MTIVDRGVLLFTGALLSAHLSAAPMNASSDIGTASSCALELAGTINAVVNLCRLGIESQVLSVDDLSRAFSAAPFTNPVAAVKHRTIALKEGFDKVLKQVRSEDEAPIREAVIVFASTVRKTEEQTSSARERTKFYSAPQLIGEQRIDDENVMHFGRFFWQKTRSGRFRAVGITRTGVQIWYPDAPEEASAKPHQIPASVTEAGRNSNVWIDTLVTGEDDILIAYNRMTLEPDPTYRPSLFARMAQQTGLKKQPLAPVRNRIGLYSFDKGEEVAYTQTQSALLEVKLARWDDGAIYVVALTMTGIEVFRKDPDGLTLIRTIRMTNTERAKLDSFPNGELLVVSLETDPEDRSRTTVKAFRPVASGSPLAVWKINQSVSWLKPHVTRAGEVVVAANCYSRPRNDDSMVYLRQSRPGFVEVKGKGLNQTIDSFLLEDRAGRILAVNAEYGGTGNADLALIEPFAGDGKARELHRVTSVSSTAFFGYRSRDDLPPPPRRIELADGREALLFSRPSSLTVHALDDFSKLGEIRANAGKDVALSFTSESGDPVFVTNSSNLDGETVIFQQLNSSQPDLRFGARHAERFLPAVEGSDGRPWVAFVLQRDSNRSSRIVFFALTSASGAQSRVAP